MNDSSLDSNQDELDDAQWAQLFAKPERDELFWEMPDDDLRSYIEDVAAATLGPLPERPTWKIHIFNTFFALVRQKKREIAEAESLRKKPIDVPPPQGEDWKRVLAHDDRHLFDMNDTALWNALYKNARDTCEKNGGVTMDYIYAAFRIAVREAKAASQRSASIGDAHDEVPADVARAQEHTSQAPNRSIEQRCLWVRRWLKYFTG